MDNINAGEIGQLSCNLVGEGDKVHQSYPAKIQIRILLVFFGITSDVLEIIIIIILANHEASPT